MLRDFYYRQICELNAYFMDHKNYKIVSVFQDYDETADDYMYHVIYDDGNMNRDSVNEFGYSLCYPEKREGSDIESIIVKLCYESGIEKEGYYNYHTNDWHVKEGDDFVIDKELSFFIWKYLDK